MKYNAYGQGRRQEEECNILPPMNDLFTYLGIINKLSDINIVQFRFG